MDNNPTNKRITKRINKMDIKEFAKEFIENVNISVEMTGNSFDEELAKSIIEYIEDNGEVTSPEICSFSKTRTRITAYDYNDDSESLDLFYLIKADTILGKINKSTLDKCFNYMLAYYREVMNGTLFKNYKGDVKDEMIEVANFVESTKGKISQLRLFVLTDGITDVSFVPESYEHNEYGFIVEPNVWDMQRVYQQNNIRAGKEKVEIDFLANYNADIQCLKMNDENPYVDAYLAIIPGITLANIYKRYQQILLEKNVRTFLQFKGKVNKAIRKTLRERPNMFFSYNNGISTTSSEIELEEIDGMTYLRRLYNWQIVNGGQTTAAIAASLKDKDVDLNKVFVPMKISVIRDLEHSDEIISEISTSANSQTAIKRSDFSANDPYLVDLETFSRRLWVPNGNSKPYCKWYFERTRGQYLDHLAQLSGYNERQFKTEYPKHQKITKTDIAKYEMTWKQHPYDVCRGAEKNYELFVTEIKREKPTISEEYFKQIVAKAILLNSIDRIVKSKELGGYKSNMNAYIMSSLSFLSNGNLDLSYIWEHQEIQDKVKEKIEEIIPLIWDHITNISASGNQASNVNERTKRQGCWEALKSKLGNVERFGNDMMQKDADDNSSYLNESQTARIKEAESVPSRCWFSLVEWAKKNKELTLMERKNAFNLGVKHDKQTPLTFKEAQKALGILKRAKELGFKYEE